MATATITEEPETWLEHEGGDVKALAGVCDTLAGWAVTFADSCALADPHGDVFDANADYDLDDDGRKRVRLHHHHRLGGLKARKEKIGYADLELRPEGIWAVAHLAAGLDPAYRTALCAKARAGGVYFSSGSAGHLVDRVTKAGGCRNITAWPILELSVTEDPASRRCTVDPESVKGADVNDPDGFGARIAELKRFQESEALKATILQARETLRRSEFDREMADPEADPLLERIDALLAGAQKTLLTSRIDGLLARIAADEAEAAAAACPCGCDGTCAEPPPDEWRDSEMDRFGVALKALADHIESRGLESLLPAESVGISGPCIRFDEPDADGFYFDARTDFGLPAHGPLLLPMFHSHDVKVRRAMGVARITPLADGTGLRADALVYAGSFRDHRNFSFSTGASGVESDGLRITRWPLRELSAVVVPRWTSLKGMAHRTTMRPVTLAGRSWHSDPSRMAAILTRDKTLALAKFARGGLEAFTR